MQWHIRVLSSVNNISWKPKFDEGNGEKFSLLRRKKCNFKLHFIWIWRKIHRKLLKLRTNRTKYTKISESRTFSRNYCKISKFSKIRKSAIYYHIIMSTCFTGPSNLSPSSFFKQLPFLIITCDIVKTVYLKLFHTSVALLVVISLHFFTKRSRLKDFAEITNITLRTLVHYFRLVTQRLKHLPTTRWQILKWLLGDAKKSMFLAWVQHHLHLK